MSSAGKFFDSFADTFDTFYDGQRHYVMRWIDQRFRSDMFIRFARTFELLGNLQEKKVLDIGCGSGPYLAEALKRGAAQAIGLDPAPRMLELARQRIERFGWVDRAIFVEGYFPNDCPPGAYDAVIVMGVMDYMDDAPSFVRRLKQVCTGRAVLSFPSMHWLRTPIRQVRYRLRNCPVYFYDETKLQQLLQQEGITNYQIDKIPGAGMDYVVCLTFS